MLQLATRNAELSDMAKILMDQHSAKHDMVVPASAIKAVNGNLTVAGDGSFTPTSICDGGIAEKLSIPVTYLRRMRAERPDLYDTNVNGWLHGPNSGEIGNRFPSPDQRSFMLRAFKGDDGNGIARAFLSQNFRVIDHLDTLTAALDAIREAGVNAEIVGADLTEKRMSVRVLCPEIAAFAPKLLQGYRSPFADGHGQAGLRRIGRGNDIARRINLAAEAAGWHGDLPLVFAGFEISNSETGHGRFLLTPRLVFQICTNGLKLTKDALASVHLGGKMDEGVIRWSDDTQRKNIELVTAQTRDAVKTFLDVEYVQGVVADIEAKAGAPVTNPQATIEAVGKELRFSEDKIRDTLNAFILGGQMTAGGVLNAVTAAAQVIEDADEAYEVEGQALRVLELARA